MNKEHKNNTKNTGFKTPDLYFKNFEASLFERLSLTEEESNCVLEKKAGFIVPDSYFENFEENLLKKIEHPVADNSRVIPFLSKRKLYYAASIAAILLLFIAIFTSKDSSVSFDSVESAVYQEYLENDASDIDTYEIAALLQEEINNSNALEDANIDHEYLLDYLSNEELTNDLFESL
jgi:uncharacterized membrane protein YvbJ